MSEKWQAAVAAARARQKPLYFVNSIMGNTLEATVSLDAARAYVSESRHPAMYRIYRQDGGTLTEIK